MRTGTVYPLELPPATTIVGRHSRPFRVADPAAYRLHKAAIDSGAVLPALPSLATLALTSTTPTFSTNFAALAFPDSDCGPDCEPPDTQVAAGPTQIFEVINVAGRLYDKSGTPIGGAFELNHLFGADPALFSSDPRIQYDTISGRWFVSLLILDTTDITTAQNGSFNLAVSKDSNPLDGFFTYSVETPGDFPDQPSLGFNDDKVGTGGNSFSCNPDCNDGPFEGNEFLIWNKSELLAGATTIDTDFYPPGEDNTDFPIIPAKSRSSTSTLWMLSAFGTQNTPPPPIVLNELDIWSVTGVPGVDTGSTANDTVTSVAAFTDPPNAPQKGSTHKINTADSRLLDVVFRDGQLWASGNDSCQPSGDTTQRSCLQFFEVLTSGVSPVVNQDFSFGTKNFFDYYPSVDLDSSDDLITSFSQSSSTEFPSAYVDGRLAGDSVNTLGTPVLFEAGAQSYNSNDTSGGPFRWGDYSGAGVDPVDQTAIWVAAEYATSATTGINWGTEIAEARVLAAPSASATPSSTATPSATPTPTGGATPTPTSSATPTSSETSTPSATLTGTGSGTPTVSATPTNTVAPTPSATATATDTATPTITATSTATATQTATPTATATPPFGVLSVSGNLSFGTEKVNSTKSKKLKIKNKGKGVLQVTTGSLVPPFIFNGSTFSLAKGKTKTVTVKFKPTAKGATASQTLFINSDDPNHPTHNLTASGAGK
jgi:hypothetical protein